MRRYFLALAIFAIVSWPLIEVARSFAQAPNENQSRVNRPAKDSDYVGSDTCATCHDEVSKKFSANPHSRLTLQHNGAGATCESCHGPGRAHVDGGGDVSKILRFSTMNAKQSDKVCLTCHAGSHANFERSSHGKAGVTCVTCHSSHAPKSESNLLKMPQPSLCYSCHTEAKSQFSQPFHHKVDEGLISCSDCHNPHGTFNDKLLKTSADQNAVCTKCHAETSEPHVYEHPPDQNRGL